MMRLSYTQTAVARSCWMKYKFRYVDGLKPVTTKPSLTLGKIVHECFEQYYNGSDHTSIINHINKSFDETISTVGPHEQEDLILAKHTALGMWNNYPHNKDFQDIKPEVEFSIPISKTITYDGRVDGLVKKNDKYWIREVKTTGLSMRQFEGRMQTSYQATGYIWALQEKMNLPIQGVMYDCIKKPLLRKRVSETATEFGERIQSDYADEKKQPHYFSRHYTYRTEEDIKNYKEDMAHLIAEICRRRDKKMFYRNTDACWSFNSECPYRRICFREPDQLTLDLYYTRTGD